MDVHLLALFSSLDIIPELVLDTTILDMIAFFVIQIMIVWE